MKQQHEGQPMPSASANPAVRRNWINNKTPRATVRGNTVRSAWADLLCSALGLAYGPCWLLVTCEEAVITVRRYHYRDSPSISPNPSPTNQQVEMTCVRSVGELEETQNQASFAQATIGSIAGVGRDRCIWIDWLGRGRCATAASIVVAGGQS